MAAEQISCFFPRLLPTYSTIGLHFHHTLSLHLRHTFNHVGYADLSLTSIPTLGPDLDYNWFMNSSSFLRPL
ncbi:9707_t:CDS:2 [Entrophospora sp. SA101]|nr:9707_t:CDS:2 [Entrophospora sp. SA101]